VQIRRSRPFSVVSEVMTVSPCCGSSTHQVRKRRQISGYMQIVSNIA